MTALVIITPSGSHILVQGNTLGNKIPSNRISSVRAAQKMIAAFYFPHQRIIFPNEEGLSAAPTGAHFVTNLRVPKADALG